MLLQQTVHNFMYSMLDCMSVLHVRDVQVAVSCVSSRLAACESHQ